MEVFACRSAVAVALLVTLAACTDDDVSDGPDPGVVAEQEATAPLLADLDRLIADADAYRFVADVLRTDAALGEPEGASDEPLFTDLFANFERVTGDDVAVWLAGVRSGLVRQSGEGCTIDGDYDGLSFDDVPDDDEDEDESGESVSAGDELLVSDESGAFGVLRLVPRDPDPYYRWEVPEGLDRTAVGALSIEVPGSDIFPGPGTLAVPTLPLTGLVVDVPLVIDSTVRWESLDDGDAIIVTLVVADENGGLYLECTTADDGEFRLPDTTLARLPEAVDRLERLELERIRTDVMTMGETIVLSSRDTVRVLLEDE